MHIAPEISKNKNISQELEFAMTGIVEHQEALGLTASEHVIFWDAEKCEPYVGEHINSFTTDDFGVLERERIARDGVDMSLQRTAVMSAA